MIPKNNQDPSPSNPAAKGPDKIKRISPFKAANYTPSENRSKTKSPNKFEGTLNNNRMKVQSNLNSFGIGNNNNFLKNGNSFNSNNFNNQTINNNVHVPILDLRDRNKMTPIAMSPIREKKREKSTYRDKIMERANQLDREEKIKEEEVGFFFKCLFFNNLKHFLNR